LDISFEDKNDGPTNMGRDIQLLERAEQGVGGARIYFWSSVWVTLGNGQKPEDALLDLSVNHIIRPTGGAAVLHGHDLTIGIAMPLADLRCSGREVKKAFLGLTQRIIAALNDCGVPAILGRDLAGRDQLASPYCFGMKSDYDVLHAETGEKICGCAMKVTRNAALLQASVPISEPIVDPAKFLRNYEPSLVLPLEPQSFARAFRQALE